MKVKFKTIERAKAKKQAQARKHRPLPWRSEPEYLSAERKARTYHTIIFSGDGKFMARVLDNEAAFIVQACNSHYELLKACKAVMAGDAFDERYRDLCAAAIRKAEGSAE